MKVYITNIRRSKPRVSNSPELFTYCEVKDAETHEMLISATLEYALDQIEEHEWQEVKEPNHGFVLRPL